MFTIPVTMRVITRVAIILYNLIQYYIILYYIIVYSIIEGKGRFAGPRRFTLVGFGVSEVARCAKDCA